MDIRPARIADLSHIMAVLEAAKDIMRGIILLASGDEREAYQLIRAADLALPGQPGAER